MSPLLWFQRLFVPQESPDEHQDVNDLPGLADDSSFVFGQHLRILLAILISILAAVMMWWIMA